MSLGLHIRWDSSLSRVILTLPSGVTYLLPEEVGTPLLTILKDVEGTDSRARAYARANCTQAPSKKLDATALDNILGDLKL